MSNWWCWDRQLIKFVQKGQHGLVFTPTRLKTESSLNGHQCSAGHGVSDDKVSEWNWQRGLARARMNSKSINIFDVYVLCLVLKCAHTHTHIYIPLFLPAIVPYLWWHKCLFCNALGLIQCGLWWVSQRFSSWFVTYWMLSLWFLFHCPCWVWVDNGT